MLHLRLDVSRHFQVKLGKNGGALPHMRVPMALNPVATHRKVVQKVNAGAPPHWTGPAA